jgi:hypothetical protein
MDSMKHTLIEMALFALAASLISCAPAPQAAAPAPTMAPALYGMPPVPGAPPTNEGVRQATTGKTADATQSQTSTPITERMIVYTVRLSLEVQDTEKAVNDIRAIASQHKGYLAATNVTRDSKNRLRGTVTLRVPAESLDAAWKQIKGAGLKVLNENSNANDVTDQYTDLNARLTNLTATEIELRKLLDTVRERTGKADDILAVYNRLTEIRGQIEQIKGQMNVLEKTSAMATLTVELVPHEEVQVLEPETWMPNRTAAQALRALVQALQGLADIAIWLVLFVLPILAALLLPFVVLALILRAIVRRRGRKKTLTAA